MTKKENERLSPWKRFAGWVEGTNVKEDPQPDKLFMGQLPDKPKKNVNYAKEQFPEDMSIRTKGFKIFAAICCCTFALILLIAVLDMPVFGSPDNPTVNEVSLRYLEMGLEETGAVNTVAGMILDYRAFDTFGESSVLFVASSAVIFLLRKKRKPGTEPLGDFSTKSQDTIQNTTVRMLVPFIMLFGIYVVLNGHISPGGGFSGGAIMGAGLIVAGSVFGQNKIGNIVTPKVTTRITAVCLLAYAAMKSYSFFTGANHVGWEIPKGIPGAIISSGFILPLNVCVGLIVACTMYTFYSLFSQGDD